MLLRVQEFCESQVVPVLLKDRKYATKTYKNHSIKIFTKVK